MREYGTMFEDICSRVGKENKGKKWVRVWVGRVDFEHRCNKALFRWRNVLTLTNSFNYLCNWMSAILFAFICFVICKGVGIVESESGAFFTILLLLVGRVWGYFWCPCDSPVRSTLNAFWYCELHENQTLLNLESCDIDHWTVLRRTPLPISINSNTRVDKAIENQFKSFKQTSVFSIITAIRCRGINLLLHH